MNRIVSVLAILFIASCMTTEDDPRRAELETSTVSQELSVCSSSCDPPTYDGNPVACASNYGCYSDSGGAYCWTGWYWNEVHCQPGGDPCGNGICETWESPWNCQQDCGPPCGDGICSPGENCQQDCGSGPVCGDGTCNGNETQASCPGDCGPQCGNGVCEAGEGPPQCECISDCSYSNPGVECW